MPAGPSVNLVATRGDVRPGEPWLLVGAHLDTVPQAPGAEDNASGIGVLLATAEALAGHRTRLPVVLVAFGSEEPRGPTDADHHYGSTAYVASLGPSERRTLRGMVAMDRVGVGEVVPVGSAYEPMPCRTSCGPRPAGPGCRRWSTPTRSRATTGRSCRRGCRVPGSAARRTPSTTRADDVPVRRGPAPSCGRPARVVRGCAGWRLVGVTRTNGPVLVDHTSARIVGAPRRP